MTDRPPEDPAEHAAQFAADWADRLDEYCALRMEGLGIPSDQIGDTDPYTRTPWRAFEPEKRTGGYSSRGITVNSGALNPELLKGEKGGRIWPRLPLKDRIDAILAHEWEESRRGSHEAAIKAAPKTKLPITDGARRVLRAIAR